MKKLITDIISHETTGFNPKMTDISWGELSNNKSINIIRRSDGFWDYFFYLCRIRLR